MDRCTTETPRFRRDQVRLLEPVEARKLAAVASALGGPVRLQIVYLKGINQQSERTAMRLIGGAFFVLALYILAQEAYVLLSGSHPAASPGGIIWLAATFVAMFALAWGKTVTVRELGNPVLMTEGRVTLIDAVLAGAVLLGLVLNAAFGFWWADPLAGLVIVYYGLREGWAA